MLERHTSDASATGICTSCGLIHDQLEPDADGYDCEECQTPTVKASLVLAGVI